MAKWRKVETWKVSMTRRELQLLDYAVSAWMERTTVRDEEFSEMLHLHESLVLCLED